MPVKKGRRALKKAGKRIYKEEYAKAKTEAIRKARTRSRKQIRTSARKKAEAKYNRTPSEKSAIRKKKMVNFAINARRMSGQLSAGLEEDTKKSKKKQKSVWDLTLNDYF